MNDLHRHDAMLRIVTDLESLPADRQADLLQLSWETRRDRRAADAALTRWLAESGWSSQLLRSTFPAAGKLLDELEASHRPALFPYESRTAAADALRCVLTDRLALPPRPAGVVEILQGPVADVLYGGLLPGLSRPPT